MNDATPWIDPELVAAGKLLQSRGLVAPDRTQAALSEVRAATDRIGAFLGEGSVPLERERDLKLPGPHGQVPCRLYLPDRAENPPLLVYAHGGGFVQGSLPSWDAMLRALVRQSGVPPSVDYRLSPEHRFPVAFDEMVAMVHLAAREGTGLGIDPTRLAVGGIGRRQSRPRRCSCLARCRRARARLHAADLRCFSTDTRARLAAFRSGRRPVADADALDLGNLSRTAGATQRLARRADPGRSLRAAAGAFDRRQPRPAARRQPPFGVRLEEAGVRCELSVYDGLNHGFIRYGRLISAARRAVGDCAAALRKALAPASG